MRFRSSVFFIGFLMILSSEVARSGADSRPLDPQEAINEREDPGARPGLPSGGGASSGLTDVKANPNSEPSPPPPPPQTPPPATVTAPPQIGTDCSQSSNDSYCTYLNGKAPTGKVPTTLERANEGAPPNPAATDPATGRSNGSQPRLNPTPMNSNPNIVTIVPGQSISTKIAPPSPDKKKVDEKNAATKPKTDDDESPPAVREKPIAEPTQPIAWTVGGKKKSETLYVEDGPIQGFTLSGGRSNWEKVHLRYLDDADTFERPDALPPGPNEN